MRSVRATAHLARLARAPCRGMSTDYAAAAQHIFPGVSRMTDLVVDRGSGVTMWTVDGKEYLDCTSGIGVLSTGHCHPKVVAAVQEQAVRCASPANALAPPAPTSARPLPNVRAPPPLTPHPSPRANQAKITHAQQSIVLSVPTLELMETMAPIMPAGLDRLFYVNSGGEAVESALRLARQATGKDSVVALLGGYHGRTQGTLA